ncbi:MAG: hypothetical protein M1833_004073 [Piccolia ochrophora]|nr:MAG: hypothetical protein M1833_004073 [Piccolia ochrophora]
MPAWATIQAPLLNWGNWLYAGVAMIIALYAIRLTSWTAMKDFREACRQDKEANITSPSCEKVLNRAIVPPPLLSLGRTKRLRSRDLLSGSGPALNESQSSISSVTQSDGIMVKEVILLESMLALLVVSAGIRFFYGAVRLSKRYPKKTELLPKSRSSSEANVEVATSRDTAPPTSGNASTITRRKNVAHSKSVDYRDLVEAAQIGDNETIVAMLKEGWDINHLSRTSPGNALAAAVKFHHPDTVSLLLEYGADPNLIMSNGSPLIHHLISMTPNVAGIDQLYEAGANIECRDASGDTLLHAAAKNGRTSLAEWLLDHGAAINAQNKMGSTALHIGVVQGPIDLVQLLIERNGDVFKTNGNGQTTLEIATQADNVEILRMVFRAHLARLTSPPDQPARPPFVSKELEAGLSSTLLHVAAECDNTKALALLLKKGADINTLGRSGTTPLIHACQKKASGSVEFLARKGAALDATSAQGFAALHVTAQTANVGLTWSLLSEGADVNVVDSNFRTPLHLAAMSLDPTSKNTTVVKLLISHGADVHHRDSNGAIALHHIGWTSCALSNHYNAMNSSSHLFDLQGDLTEVLDSLFDAGSNVDASDRSGKTPLHYAASHSYPLTIQLLKRRANPLAIDNDRNTPLHIALDTLEREAFGDTGNYEGLRPRQQCHNSIKELVEHGARIDLCNKLGENALDVYFRIRDRESPLNPMGWASFSAIEREHAKTLTPSQLLDRDALAQRKKEVPTWI